MLSAQPHDSGAGIAGPRCVDGDPEVNGVGTPRLFVSLIPDSDVVRALVRHRSAWTWPAGVALPPAANLHLTLAFLGDVHMTREEAVRSALARVLMRPLELRLAKPEVWEQARVAVLCPEPHQGLDALRAEIAGALSEVAIALDPRPFKAHITLAKRAADANPPEGCTAIAWSVRSFELVWSRLAPTFDYEVLESWTA